MGGAFLVTAGFAAASVGLEFLPKLEEGNVWMRAALPPSVSLEEGNGYVNRMRTLMKSFPEVETGDLPAWPARRRHRSRWLLERRVLRPLEARRQMATRPRQARLIAEMPTPCARPSRRDFAFSQYIQDNVQEAASGIDAENAIKVSGPDLATLQKIAIDVRRAIEGVRGITDIQVSPRSASRRSASTSIVSAPPAMGCRPATSTPRYRRPSAARRQATYTRTWQRSSLSLLVRLAPQYRHSMEAIRQIAIGVQGGDGVTQCR